MQSVEIVSSEPTRRSSQDEGIKRQVETRNIENDKYMFENQVACDVTLTALSLDGNSVSVPAHKYVLISRNSVFRAMFCGPLSDKSDTIHVPDISSEALTELLRYLYYGEVCLDGDTVLELMNAASKYMIPPLTAACSEYLAHNIDSDNACMILEYALLYDESDLIRKCLRYVQRYTAQILNNESFLGIRRETLQAILNLDSLSVSEDVLVGALLKWAEAQIDLTPPTGEAQNKNHEHTRVGSVFNGILDKIRVTSLSEAKIQELLESKNDLAVQLAVMVCVLRSRIPENVEETENIVENISIKPRLELPTGHVTCDVIASSSSCLVYNGRACAPLVVETSEPITIHKIHLLDRTYTSTARVQISITQNDACLINFEFPCAVYRKTTDLGPVFSLSLPQPIQVEEGQFKIEARYVISHGSYGSVQVGAPKCSQQKFGGLEFIFPNTSTSTPVASFEVSVA